MGGRAAGGNALLRSGDAAAGDSGDVALGVGNVLGAPTYLVEHPNLDPTLWNFHTEPGSLGYNAGDPGRFDDDGVSQSSIGSTFSLPYIDTQRDLCVTILTQSICAGSLSS